MKTSDEPTAQDWTALLYLAGTGMNECPWGWDDSYHREFPRDWERTEFQGAIDRCREKLYGEGKLS